MGFNYRLFHCSFFLTAFIFCWWSYLVIQFKDTLYDWWHHRMTQRVLSLPGEFPRHELNNTRLIFSIQAQRHQRRHQLNVNLLLKRNKESVSLSPDLWVHALQTRILPYEVLQVFRTSPLNFGLISSSMTSVFPRPTFSLLLVRTVRHEINIHLVTHRWLFQITKRVYFLDVHSLNYGDIQIMNNRGIAP